MNTLPWETPMEGKKVWSQYKGALCEHIIPQWITVVVYFGDQGQNHSTVDKSMTIYNTDLCVANRYLDIHSYWCILKSPPYFHCGLAGIVIELLILECEKWPMKWQNGKLTEEPLRNMSTYMVLALIPKIGLTL